MNTVAATTITVSHREDAVDVSVMCSEFTRRIGVDVLAEISFDPGKYEEALEAVERIAASLRRQIADAAERTPIQP